VLLCSAVVAALPLPVVAQGGVVDNVLLRWRETLEKCEGSPMVDRTAPADLEAMVHVAMYEAVNAVAGKYQPYVAKIAAPRGTSEVAAAAQAARDVIAKGCAEQTAAADGLLSAVLSSVTDSAARAGGVTVGKQAAAAILAARGNSGSTGLDDYFPAAKAGVYMPTIRQTGVRWSRTTPWVMRAPNELRPAAPPALSSETWARDYEEIRRMGGKTGSARTAVQTDIAQFWAPRDVRIVLRQLVGLPGRSLVDDARFLALAEMAWADSYVSMMDGKYAFNFWRPVTAIRGGAVDGNDRTIPDANWTPLANTPPHPEYPCGHCLSAAAVGAVIEAEFGSRMPAIVLEMEGALLRRYPTAQAYLDEVAESRLLVGVHYRFSLEAGKAMGLTLGKLAVERQLRPIGR
jgi:hypothetical protein